MSKNVFFIGPASVGKTTIGEKLAHEIGYTFVDIDKCFVERYGDIVEYMKAYGYDSYCKTNDRLTDELIANVAHETVFATPAGYAIYEDFPGLADKQREILEHARSVLLLPSEDPEDAADMIAERQTKRWPEATHAGERAKHIGRHALYRQMGNVKVIGEFSIDEVVDLTIWGLGESRIIDNS